MSKRADKRKTYGRAWDTWDPELLASSLAEGFVFDDPAMPAPVTKDSADNVLSRHTQISGRRMTEVRGGEVTICTDYTERI